VSLNAMAVFRCVDDKGVTRIGDTPPDQCYNVVMYEVSTTGMVLRRIEPSLTPEQVRAKNDEVERRKEADKVAYEQKRKDLALLATYSAEAEIDMTRDRNIEPLNGRIKSAQDRIVAIDKRTTELNEEMEFYKAGKSKLKTKDGKEKAAPEAPSMLTGELQRLKHERDTLTKNVTGYEREIIAMKSKYDTDKKRWLALKSGKLDEQPGALPPDPKPDAKAAVKVEAKPAAPPKK
jgi:chromosome segregation ATPase